MMYYQNNAAKDLLYGWNFFETGFDSASVRLFLDLISVIGGAEIAQSG
jgi:hypothetical protein